MTDCSSLHNWADNEAIFINKGLQKKSRLLGKQKLGKGDTLSLRCLWGKQVATAKGKKRRWSVFPITWAPDLLKVQSKVQSEFVSTQIQLVRCNILLNYLYRKNFY